MVDLYYKIIQVSEWKQIQFTVKKGKQRVTNSGYFPTLSQMEFIMGVYCPELTLDKAHEIIQGIQSFHNIKQDWYLSRLSS